MALNEHSRKMIEDNIPNFDFSIDRSSQEWNSALRVAQKLAVKNLIATRLAALTERGVVPGVTMESETGEQAVLSSVTSDAHLVFKAKKGSFNADYWKVVA